MSSLISLNQEYINILHEIEQNDGLISNEIESNLIKNLNESKDKVSNYCLMLDAIDADIEFCKARINQAKEYVDRLEKKKESLKQIALSVVQSRNEKLEGNDGRWIGRRKSTSVNIIDESKIPSFYIKLKPELDKALIKQELSNGNFIEGAELVIKESLTWK